jgi:exonuclease SbcD
VTGRFLHIADAHFDVTTHGHADPATGLNSRLLDVANSWEHACGTAVEQAVDALVIAGDTFHTPNPSAEALALFGEGLRHLRDAYIPVLIIDGNHDRAPHSGCHSIVEFLHDPPHVYGISRPQIDERGHFVPLEVGGITFACLPSVGREQLLARSPGLSRMEAEQAVIDGLRAILDVYRTGAADVLVAHWGIAEAIIAAPKLALQVVDEPMLSTVDLEGPWSYAALGHFHGWQEWETGATHCAYSGSLERISFTEENQEKVALEVDLVRVEPGDPIIPTAHVLPARRFKTLSLADYTDGQLPDLEGAIVRVKDEVTEDQAATIDRAGIMHRLEAAGAASVKYAVEVRREVRRRAEAITDVLAPIEALDELMRIRDVAEEERQPLRDLMKQTLEEIRR